MVAPDMESDVDHNRGPVGRKRISETCHSKMGECSQALSMAAVKKAPSFPFGLDPSPMKVSAPSYGQVPPGPPSLFVCLQMC